MRVASAALLLCSGVHLFCQSSTPVPANPDNANRDTANPDKQGQNPPSVFLQQKDFSKGPPVWQITPGEPLKLVVPPGTGSFEKLGRQWRQFGAPPVDPEMIVRPPASSIGAQPPGTQIAQNLYPGLELLPVDWSKFPINWSKFKEEPIPTAFPNMKVEPIPITWPQYKAVYAQSNTVAKPAK
ncbi:MAG: hypothetical protein ABSG51_01720 [Terracidiphilus sp.]|jgi:hypothetical protein